MGSGAAVGCGVGGAGTGAASGELTPMASSRTLLQRASLPYRVTHRRCQERQVNFVSVLSEEAGRGGAKRVIAFDALEPHPREPLSVEGDGIEAPALGSVRSEQVEDDLATHVHAPKVSRNQVEVFLRRGSAGRNHDGREFLGR